MMERARDSLAKAARRMRKYADQGRRPLDFQVGDRVWLKLTPQVWKKLHRKDVHKGLISRYDGPFEIIQKVGNAAYRLNLPERLKLHPTFHVSFLKPCHDDPANPERNRTERAPPTVRKEFTRAAEKILDRKIEGQSKKNRRTFYLVKWKGLPDSKASWERDTTLWQFERLVQQYLSSVPTRASGSSSGGGL